MERSEVKDGVTCMPLYFTFQLPPIATSLLRRSDEKIPDWEGGVRTEEGEGWRKQGEHKKRRERADTTENKMGTKGECVTTACVSSFCCIDKSSWAYIGTHTDPLNTTTLKPTTISTTPTLNGEVICRRIQGTESQRQQLTARGLNCTGIRRSSLTVRPAKKPSIFVRSESPCRTHQFHQRQHFSSFLLRYDCTDRCV
jgi:hypothetical protein